MKSKVFGLLAAAMLAGPTWAQGQGVVINGFEWRQVDETRNVSWNQVAGACDVITGACAGSIGAVSFAGWTWAANTDVQSLFEQLILPGSTQFPTSTSSYSEFFDFGIAAAIGSGAGQFRPTDGANSGFGRFVYGISRTLLPDGSRAYQPTLNDWYDNPLEIDAATLNSTILLDEQSASTGVWLFRSATVTGPTVPEPSTVALLGVGLAGLAIRRRRSAA